MPFPPAERTAANGPQLGKAVLPYSSAGSCCSPRARGAVSVYPGRPSSRPACETRPRRASPPAKKASENPVFSRLRVRGPRPAGSRSRKRQDSGGSRTSSKWNSPATSPEPFRTDSHIATRQVRASPWDTPDGERNGRTARLRVPRPLWTAEKRAALPSVRSDSPRCGGRSPDAPRLDRHLGSRTTGPGGTDVVATSRVRSPPAGRVGVSGSGGTARCRPQWWVPDLRRSWP